MSPENVDSRFCDFIPFERREIAPDVIEVSIEGAGVVFRIAPHLAVTVEQLTHGRDDLEVESIEINGKDHWVAHKGLTVHREKQKKSKDSGTWYYAVSQSRRPAVYIQGLGPDVRSSHHRHHQRTEQIIPLFGECIVRINGVDHDLKSGGSLKFPLQSWHQVYTDGMPAVNCLIINGPGDCQDMTDHEPYTESLI